jgi:hypothetical protein
VIAGSYDGPVERIGDWLRAARGIPRVDGVMYTTWRGRFDDLERFAGLVRAGR